MANLHWFTQLISMNESRPDTKLLEQGLIDSDTYLAQINRLDMRLQQVTGIAWPCQSQQKAWWDS